MSDLHEIIGLASKLAESEPDRLSPEELRAIAAELDISQEHLDQAEAELQRRRAALLEQEARRALLFKRVALGVGLALGALVLWMVIAQAGIRSAWHRVDGRRAQLINVMERQAATVAQWRDAPEYEQGSADRSAELSGAENRVRVERKRYDDAATDYNTRVDGLVSGAARAVFGLPPHAPLSNEVDTW